MSADRQTVNRIEALEAAINLGDTGNPPDVDPLDRLDVLRALIALTVALSSVELLEARYSRAELDAMAEAAGIEDAAKLPNKRVVAEHIHDHMIDVTA